MGKFKREKTKYYHASPVLFKPGDQIVPNRFPNFKATDPNLIYLTNSPKPHYTVYDKGAMENWYIYQVLPTNTPKIRQMWDELVTDKPVIVVKMIGSVRGIGRPKKGFQKNNEEDKIFIINTIKELKDIVNNQEKTENFIKENPGVDPEKRLKLYISKLQYHKGDVSEVKKKMYYHPSFKKNKKQLIQLKKT